MKQVNYVVGGVVAALVASASSASAQQVMWKDNPITGKVVGLTYGTSGWNAAEAQAVAYGGHLVTVRSGAENQWLLQEFGPVWGGAAWMNNAPWHGLNRAGVTGQWSWSSGEPVGYFAWAQGEPGGSGSNQKWTQFLPSGQWDPNDEGGQFGPLRALVEVPQRPVRSWSWPDRYSNGAQAQLGLLEDLDGDADLDFIASYQGSIVVSLNNGSGSFASQQSIVGCGTPSHVVALDDDSDGDLDLWVADLGGRVLRVTKDSSGNYSSPSVFVTSSESPQGLAVADITGDGIDDLLCSFDSTAVQLRVYPGQSTGGFSSLNQSYSSLVSAGASQISCGDLDGDGLVDVVIGGGWSSLTGVRIMKGIAGGTLQSLPNSFDFGFVLKPELVDVDGDGDLDLVVPEGQPVGGNPPLGSNVRIYRNDGSFNFTLQANLAVEGRCYWTACRDLDGDGDIDLAAAMPDQNLVQIWIQNSLGGFQRNHNIFTDAYPIWVVIGDLDLDGKSDVISANRDGNSWLVVRNQSVHDCNNNSIDDPIDIASGFSTDCNSNGRPDSCETLIPANDCNGDSILDACQVTALTDCNNNSRLDTCDLASGAPDCNGNQILDVCEPLTAVNDCNGNGLLDYCELVAGTAPDCNLNSRPDSCDLAAGLPDCNLNQVPDACDLGAGTSNDGDLNNIPDECSLDCNANGLLDTAECAQGLTADCNGNLVPDSCDLVAGVPDCNTNGVPDSCDVAGGQDCNANGQPDACDLAAGGLDCNGNQQLDSCELAAGGGDCNGNQQFDACELLAGAPDCNGNGALDACDIAAGAADCDGNQVPDACQPLDAASDCNANLILDVCDILGGAPDCNGNGRPDSCDVDTNGDQTPDECQDGGTLYCFGDGAANSTPCPCGGVGAPRSGCPNSVNPAGGYLVATGLPSRIADTLVLRASQMPPVATVLYFQGTSQASTASGTIGTVFGDGLRCAAGAVVRVGFRTNSAGASEIPSGGSPALHIAGQIPATGAVTRYYQGWYRDVNPSFCTANRYNLTNGVAVVWVP